MYPFIIVPEALSEVQTAYTLQFVRPQTGSNRFFPFCTSIRHMIEMILTRFTVSRHASPITSEATWSAMPCPCLHDCSLRLQHQVILEQLVAPHVNLYRYCYLTSQANKKEMKVKFGSGLAGDEGISTPIALSVLAACACLSAAWLVPTCLNWCICPINETDGQRFTWVIYAGVESAARSS